MQIRTNKNFRLGITEINRLLELVNSLAVREGLSAPDAIGRLERLAAPAAAQAHKGRIRTDLANFVERLRNVRMRRNTVMGAPLFRDPAWDMMLALYGAYQQGRSESITSLCYASGVPTTTALRQLTRLEAHGLIAREGDQADLRRCWIVPTPKAIAGVEIMATLLAEETLAVQIPDAPTGSTTELETSG